MGNEKQLLQVIEEEKIIPLVWESESKEYLCLYNLERFSPEQFSPLGGIDYLHIGIAVSQNGRNIYENCENLRENQKKVDLKSSSEISFDDINPEDFRAYLKHVKKSVFLRYIHPDKRNGFNIGGSRSGS